MWDDKIARMPPLSSVIELEEIKNWLSNKGLLQLPDICSWDNVGNWEDWSIPELPDHLCSQTSQFISLLAILAPIHRSDKDQWGWGHSMFYSDAQGFSVLLAPHVSHLSPVIWKLV